MAKSIKFSSQTKLQPGLGFVVSHGKRKWELLLISELNDAESSDLSRSIRFSTTTRNMVQSTLPACVKAIEVITKALAEQASPSHWFPFLKLPREIRDMIYKFILVKAGQVRLNTETYNKRNGFQVTTLKEYQPSAPNIDLSIFRVSKLVSEEASPIFYSQNNFFIERLAMDTRPQNMYFFQYVHELSIDWPERSYDNEAVTSVLLRLQMLKVLHINVGYKRTLIQDKFWYELLKLRGIQKISLALSKKHHFYNPSNRATCKAACDELESILQRVVTCRKELVF